MKKIAIVGTQGVPARYGGFESLVENIIGDNCSPDIQYTVFCSGKDMPNKRETYKGCCLKYLPLRANGIQSIPYDMLSMLRTIRGYDVILVLGISGCVFLPLLKILSRGKIIVNIDGLEHRREKWGKFARNFLRFSESLAIRFADVIITDNKGIQNYVRDRYQTKTELIAYGGNHVLRNVPIDRQMEILQQYGLQKREYAISVCRIEPENNCHLSLEAFSKSPVTFVFVGNWKHCDYSRELRYKYNQYKNILLLDSIYDLDTLYSLRANAAEYIHGHSAGGTNPSLVEAMFFGNPILCYDVVYNRETTANMACYFSTPDDLLRILSGKDLSGSNMARFAQDNYTWKCIAEQYEALY